MYRYISGLCCKLPPNANFEEEENESQSNYPRDNKRHLLLAWSEVAQQMMDGAYDDFALWQYSTNSMAHCRGNKPKCSSARNFALNQPTKCTQELLALRHHSVNATPESDREWNRCHCSVQSLINGTDPSLDRKQLTARYLERGSYCCALNKSEVGRRIRY